MELLTTVLPITSIYLISSVVTSIDTLKFLVQLIISEVLLLSNSHINNTVS